MPQNDSIPLHVPEKNADFWGTFPSSWQVIGEALARLLRRAKKSPGSGDGQLASDALHTLEVIRTTVLRRTMSPDLEAAIVAVIGTPFDNAGKGDQPSSMSDAVLRLALEWQARERLVEGAEVPS